MTYLEVVNSVMRRLREREVSNVSQTTYSTMVGDFVNDAKRIIEGRWNWSANRSEITVTTASSDKLYSLTGFGQDGKVLTAYNSSGNSRLIEKPQAWMDRQNNTGQAVTGTPEYFCYRSVDGSDDTQIEVYPTPDGVHTLKFYCYTYQSDLTDNTDDLNIPSLPVIHLAVAMLAEEKGEAGGSTSARYFEMADKFLSDAIMADANKNTAELEWMTI